MGDSLTLPSTGNSTTQSGQRVLFVIGIATAIATWLLLLVGGLVTTFRVGMAVPDWPTTFGINMFLYNFFDKSWGIILEHTHRLLGTVVGLGCIVLAVWSTGTIGTRAWRAVGCGTVFSLVTAGLWTTFTDFSPFLATVVMLSVSAFGLALWFGLRERSGLVSLAWLVLCAVILQGMLGGFRVNLNQTTLAAIHGCTGQAFFGMVVGLTIATSRTWTSVLSRIGSDRFSRLLTIGLVVLLYGQILAGAWLRHFQFGLQLHAGFGYLVTATVVGVGLALCSRRFGRPVLRRPALFVLGLVGIQFLLGLASWWVLRPFDGIPRMVDTVEALVRTAHQANGALLLGAAVTLAMNAWRTEATCPDTSEKNPEATISGAEALRLEMVTQ